MSLFKILYFAALVPLVVLTIAYTIHFYKFRKFSQ